MRHEIARLSHFSSFISHLPNGLFSYHLPRYDGVVKRFQQIIIGVLGLLLLVVAVQSFLPTGEGPIVDDPIVEAPCTGAPIPVDFAYTGGVNEPWTCQVQCDDNKQRYILYSNGKATQCETLPGCNDTGEDSGVTCAPPEAAAS